MTNYNDGKWYGFNGGECPVHPETLVEWINTDGDKGEASAGLLSWNADGHPVAAFRVIKEHKEPREFWLVCGGYMSCAGFARKNDANHCALIHGGEVVHVREVTP